MQIPVAHRLEVFDPEAAEPCPNDNLVMPVRSAEAVMGETAASFLARAGWRFDLPTILVINGECYARAEWETYHLALGDDVAFVSRPLGPSSSSGGSSAKSIGAIVGLIALTALAPYAMGAIGLTGMAAGIGSSLLVAGGAALVSHFLQPKTTGTSATSDEIYSFAFQSNAARPLQAIPVGYGRSLRVPDLASPSFTEFSGDGMVEYALYCIGCGQYELEELRIGDTTIWTAAGGFDPAFPGISLQFVQPGEQVTLIPINVVTSSEVTGTELTTDWAGGYTANAAETAATEILLDFVFPSGAYVTYKDRTLPTPVSIDVQARTVNDGGGPTSDWFDLWSTTYDYAKQTEIRITEHIPVPPGRYEIRVRRVNPTITGQTLFDGKVSGTDTIQWTALRAHIDGPQSFDGVTTLALRAEANASLGGFTNGKLGVITTRILPVWDVPSGTFVDRPTRSIAWAALDAWRNEDYSAGLSLDHVDLQSFIAYDALWASLGHSFDYFFTEPTSLDDVEETILKAGRAMPAFVGDRMTIVRDEPRGIPRMMFNDHNIVRDSLSIDYVIADQSFADGVVGQYVDEQSWRPADVSSAPDGQRLAKPAQISLDGVVNRAQAAGLVRFHAAENQYRRITATWQTGAAGKLLKKGDLVTLSCEEPETWGQSAELLRYDEASRSLWLTGPATWDPTADSHYVQVERRDGQPWGPVRVTRGASDDHLVVNQADLAMEADRQGSTLWEAVTRSDTMELPLVDFSPGQPRSFAVLITEGTPDTDGEHITLTGAMDAPEVYDVVDTGVPPLPSIPNVYSSSLPIITTIGAQVFQRALGLVISAGWSQAANAASYKAEISYDSGGTWLPAYSGDRNSFEAQVAGAAVIYLRVAGVTAAGVRGVWSISDPIVPPDLKASAQYITFSLTKEDFEQRIARAFDALELLDITADLVTETNVLADAANELGKANVKQILAAQVDIDKAYAIFGTDVVAQFGQSGATVSEKFTSLAQADQAQAQATEDVSASLGQLKGSVDQRFATQATTNDAQAQATTDVKASVGDLSASVTQQFNAQASFNGQLTSSYIVKVAAGNYWGGLQIITANGQAGATLSEFRIATDKLLVGAPGSGLGDEYFFTIANVNGQARVAIRGDLVGDGMIGAPAIQAQSLSAISADLGNINAGHISLTGGNGSFEIWDNT